MSSELLFSEIIFAYLLELLVEYHYDFKVIEYIQIFQNFYNPEHIFKYVIWHEKLSDIVIFDDLLFCFGSIKLDSEIFNVSKTDHEIENRNVVSILTFD